MLRSVYHFMTDKKIPTLASALAFMILLNGGSFLFLYILLSSFFNNSFFELLLDQITDGQIKNLLLYFFQYQNNLSYSIFLIATSIYSSSSLYYHLMNIVELMMQSHLQISLSKRIFSVILTIIYLFILNLITLLLTELILFLDRFYQLLSYTLILLVLLLTIYFLNFVALKDYRLKRIYKGVLFTFLYSIFFTIGFAVYLNFFSNFKIVYGVLAFFIILFFYIYAVCFGFLLGIYINFKNIKWRSLLKNKE